MTGTRDYFRSFCNISKALGTTLHKTELLDLIVKSAIETMDGKAACIFLYDPSQDIFVPAAHMGLSDTYSHAAPMKARQMVSEIMKGGYIEIFDALSDQRVENHAIKRAEGIQSILVVPVIVQDKSIGVLSLYTADLRKFNPEEIEFLQALAEQSGIAIQTANLIEKIERNTKLFYEISSGINSSLDIKKILHILSSQISEALRLEGVVIQLMNRETDKLDLVASYGLSSDFVDQSKFSELQWEEMAIGDILFNEHALEELDSDNKEMRKLYSMYVPISANEEIIGVMQLSSISRLTFDFETTQLIRALSNQGGLAIQNASMYLLLEQDKKCLEEDIWHHKSWF